MKAVPLPSEVLKHNLRVLITAEQIRQKIGQTARLIEKEYRGKDLLIVAVMKGAICLASDLMREIDLPLTLESIQCSSYGLNGAQRGALSIFGLDRLSIGDKDVLIVDDILDSGTTLQGIYEAFAPLSPRSLKSCVLLEKNVVRTAAVQPDYALFKIENLFVVGYGLDYKEHYRSLPSICVLAP